MNTHKPSIQLPYPSGFLRAVMRFPILFYRLKLGWLLGRRFLLLEHRGRKSGLLRKAVIEVVDFDPQTGSCVVAAAWGNKSDWYQNIQVEPQVTIGLGSRRFPALARTLLPEDATRHLETYAARYPFAFRQLGSLLVGIKSHDTLQIIQAFIDAVPFVEFVPTGEIIP